MSADMPVASHQPSAQYQALYRATVEEAAAGGGMLMGKLVAATGMALHAREKAALGLHEREAHAASARLLQGKQAELRAQYPKALLAAFTNPELSQKVLPRNLAEVHFDQVELMDELQVQESVTMARAQQSAMLAADASLAELNTLICRMLGLATVRPERNPLRPEVYVNVLKEVVVHLQVPAATRLDWLAIMSQTLGQELRDVYLNFSARLHSQGVMGAGYAVTQTRTGVDSAHALLTLDKLRRLLAGELGPDTPELIHAESFSQRFSQQFSREFDGAPVPDDVPVLDFASTVPAAFEALAEMKQVDQVVQQLEQRRQAGPIAGAQGEASIAVIRQALRRTAGGVAQALSLEVVTLMVDNIAMDSRLLDPVQRVIRGLEPALLRLVLVDPRFFTDKQHPARALLQEITHRSLAYGSVCSRGFPEFMAELEGSLAGLADAAIDNAEPFEHILLGLRRVWGEAEARKLRDNAAAVGALQSAEQRNVLADKIAYEIDSHPDAARVPPVVLNFLCGPWSQVVAQARIAGGAGSGVADKYQALISAMLWSAHPDLAHQNAAKLTRLVPLLLSTLRDGLDTIQYPSTKTSAFLEALMGLHQQAFRAAQKPAKVRPEPDVSGAEPVAPRLHRVAVDDPWVAPQEAKASNFMELPDLPEPSVLPPVTPVGEVLLAEPAADLARVMTYANQDEIGELPLGSWVELLVKDQWVRTQLIWASQHGTLFLFTSVLGASQSMARRSRDKMWAAGTLRVISGLPVVDDALDAVAQTAMRNSMDT